MSKNAKRRAIVLAAIYVLMAIHIIQWKLTGRTISPIEPSESMQTLEQGMVNAGFIFFAAALLATAIFGRFFCGWGCHIVALQDLCLWLMKKCGVHPKPFRSRLLMFAPLGFALYMFVWPTFKRIALTPALNVWWPDALAFIGASPPLAGFSNHLLTTDYWRTFAGPIVAVPFLLICGFATVYLLGAKGFCTYGCPYGGFFAPLDSVAPGRIIVDKAKCKGSGHCTAVCTSNVRVHEEVRDFGMVTDPGCMKCMDCVSVCPNGALSFGFAPPPILGANKKKRAKRRVYDLSLGEDVALVGAFVFCLFAYRGLYGLIPMLMAIGAAGCSTFLFWKMTRLLRDKNSRLRSFQLKRQGVILPAGYAWLLTGVLVAAFTLHAGEIKHRRMVGVSHRHAVDKLVSREIAFAQAPGTIPDEALDEASKAIRSLGSIVSFRHGGIGLLDTPSVNLDLAWLHLVRNEPDVSEKILERTLQTMGVVDALRVDLARLQLMQGKRDLAISSLKNEISRHPALIQSREMLVQLLAQQGRYDEIETVYTQAVKLAPDDVTARARLAALYVSMRRFDDALVQSRQAVKLDPNSAAIRNDLAVILMYYSRVDEAVDQFAQAARLDPDNAVLFYRRAAELLKMDGEDEKASVWFERARQAEQR